MLLRYSVRKVNDLLFIWLLLPTIEWLAYVVTLLYNMQLFFYDQLFHFMKFEI